MAYQEGGAMQKRIRRAMIGILALFCLLGPSEAPAGKQTPRMIEASAYNPSSGFFEKTEYVDRRQIDIEQSYTYVSHSVLITTANPKEESSGKWSCSDGLIRGKDGGVEAVWIEVKAANKDLFDDAVRVRARLTVIVEERDGN
jgi:hypothetical protein